MKRTMILLAAASLTMLGLDLAGSAHIPWWVVVIPIAVPLLEWVALGVLAVGLTLAAAIFAPVQAYVNKRRKQDQA